MSLVTAGIDCTVSPHLSGAMEDCSIVRGPRLQRLCRQNCRMSGQRRMFGSLWSVVVVHEHLRQDGSRRLSTSAYADVMRSVIVGTVTLMILYGIVYGTVCVSVMQWWNWIAADNQKWLFESACRHRSQRTPPRTYKMSVVVGISLWSGCSRILCSFVYNLSWWTAKNGQIRSKFWVDRAAAGCRTCCCPVQRILCQTSEAF